MPSSDLARNLRHLCTEARSVSEVCREIGINRQQFARYLNGSGRPSAHNLRRISSYFGVPEDRLTAPHPDFLATAGTGPDRTFADSLAVAFPGDLRGLRGFTGTYHSYFMSPSQPGRVIRAYVDLTERNGRVMSRTIERTVHPHTRFVRRARFNGLVAMYDGTLFSVEWGRREHRSVSETILTPARRGARQWLIGRLLGFSWYHRRPYDSVVVWKRLAPSISARDALAACGSFSPDNRTLDRVAVDTLMAGD